MTAEEIRKMPVPEGQNDTNHLKFLREIAAQIAEFNERCEKNCTPPKPESYHHEGD
jgi:hypothetical protein